MLIYLYGDQLSDHPLLRDTMFRDRASQFKTRLKWKVNVDENTELAQEHGVQSIPTLLVFKGGNLSETIVGLKSKDELVKIVEA